MLQEFFISDQVQTPALPEDSPHPFIVHDRDMSETKDFKLFVESQICEAEDLSA